MPMLVLLLGADQTMAKMNYFLLKLFPLLLLLNFSIEIFIQELQTNTFLIVYRWKRKTQKIYIYYETDVCCGVLVHVLLSFSMCVWVCVLLNNVSVFFTYFPLKMKETLIPVLFSVAFTQPLGLRKYTHASNNVDLI